MAGDRPVHLNLFVFRWPLAAIASITHRITGVIAFVGIAFMLYALEGALSSPEGFEATRALMQTPLARFITFGLLSVVGYHLVAGLKHLLLDMHIGDSLEGGRLGAQITVVLGVVVVILSGVWAYGY